MKQDHEVGRKTIGGFPGHEHFHPYGEQICFNCGRTLREIIAQGLLECDYDKESMTKAVEEIGKKLKKQ